MTAGDAQTQNVYASGDQLRVGVYVFIDLPWFQHPFALNSFCIASLEHVVTLRALGQHRFPYNPERSDAAQLAMGARQAESPVATQVFGAASASSRMKDDRVPMRACDALPVDADNRAPTAVDARGNRAGAGPRLPAASPADAAYVNAQWPQPPSYGGQLAHSTRQAHLQRRRSLPPTRR